jgi:NADH-quinone oxidoreductase subunit J
MIGMTIAFYFAAAISILATLKALTELHAVRALLYLIVSLLSVAVTFYVLGAPFASVLEVIVYAGAIMVLFVFVIMVLNLGPLTVAQERKWLNTEVWLGPLILALILFGALLYPLALSVPAASHGVPGSVNPEQVGSALFGTYALGVELASLLLLAALIGACHLGRREGS